MAAKLDHEQFTPTFGDPGFLDLSRFDAVLPLRIDDYPAVRAAIRNGCRAFVPSEEAVALCDDKLALNRFLIDKGFGVNIPTLFDTPPGHPCIMKPRHGESGEGCQLVDGTSEAPKGYFLQRMIAGEHEFGLHALRVAGEVRFVTVMLYEMGAPDKIKSKVAPALKTTRLESARFERLAEQILGVIDYEGTACINFKLVDRRPMIFEVNPRFGASLIFEFNDYARAYCEAVGLL